MNDEVCECGADLDEDGFCYYCYQDDYCPCCEDTSNEDEENDE